jgi:hypothetical protein
MKDICRIEVRTISETGKDATIPAIEERRPTSMEVLKNSHAIISVSSQPIIPLVSAANCFFTIKNTIATIGSSVKPTDRIISAPLATRVIPGRFSVSFISAASSQKTVFVIPALLGLSERGQQYPLLCPNKRTYIG